MDTTILRSFVLIARHGHLGKAASELHLCKPAVSAHLKELERIVEHPLFERSSTGMRLTEAGQQLLPLAQQAITAHDVFDTAAQGYGQRLSGQVDLGLAEDPIWARVPQALAFLQRHHPDLSINLRWCDAECLQRDTIEGRLSAGWLLGPVDQPGLSRHLLTKVPIRVAGPLSWKRQLETATLEQLADFPWIDSPGAVSLTTHRNQLFAESTVQPACPICADSERAVYGIIAEGLAVGMLREEMAMAGQTSGDLCIWPGPVPDLHLHFVLPMIRSTESIGRALIDAVRRAWNTHQQRGRKQRRGRD